MEAKVKTLKPKELLESFMNRGTKRDSVFKQGYELFYIASLESLTEISKNPVPPVKAITHSLIFLKTGLLFMKVGSQSIKIHPNECVVIPAGQVFSYSKEEEENSQEGGGFICGFNDDFLIGQIGSRDLLKSFEFLSIWGNPIIKPKRQSAIYLSQSLSRILAEYAKNGLQNKLLIQAYLIAILCDLSIDYLPLSKHPNKRAIELTKRFKEYLHKKINSTHKVSDYAALLNISPNHLNKSIKLITQKSPSDWIRETLINEAKVLLFQTDLSVQEVAFELGINDPSYFARLFKKQEGKTPLEYKKMIDLS